jgi:prephenate dehydratase
MDHTSSSRLSAKPYFSELDIQPVVSIQGQPGSFHHIGALRLFGEVEFLYRDSFREVFEDANRGKSNFQFIAIENSIAGSIIYNYDLLAKNKIPIVAEKYLRISQHLIAKPDVMLDQITEVWSHPMAIEQCRNFLDTLSVKVLEKEDTAGSVRDLSLSDRTDVAVISSDFSAQLYKMNILRRNIETDPNNYTRFLLLSREVLSSRSKSELRKTSIYFGTPHKPGGLVTFLQQLHKFDINMTKLESRPRVGSPWVYDFFADIQLDAFSEQGKKILAELSDYCEFITVLGSYADLSEPDFV